MGHELPQLAARCLAGDQSAMIELVDRYRETVFRFCYRMLGQRQDAEDAAQETLVRMLRSLARWDAERPFEPWLMAIAANRCRTLLAARARRTPHRVLHDDQFADESQDWQSVSQLQEEVQLALERLRPDYRQAFLLFHEHGLSCAQIGTVLGCPVGTVKTWIHRARQHLAGWLQKREVVASKNHGLRGV